MNERQANLTIRAREILEKTAGSDRSAAQVLWKYECPETKKDFYLPGKQTTVKSPYTGKSFSAKPTRFSMTDVAEELKSDAKSKEDKDPPSKKKASDWNPETTGQV